MQRLAYMKQLGIDVYVPRKTLPQAKASVTGLQPVLAVSVTPPAEASAAAPRGSYSAPAPTPASRPGLELPETAVVPGPRKPAVRTPPRPLSAANSVRFQLLTVAFDSGVVFVSDLKTAPLPPALEATVLQFLRELMFALGRSVADDVAPAYFQWPLVSRQGVATGADRASEVLAGFLERQLRETRPQHLVLLGDKAAEYIQPRGELLVNFPVQVWRSVALGKLFARPELKADLWRTLQPLVVNG
jgi:hypothetical protein